MHKGIRGFVKDKKTGAAVKDATVVVSGIAHNITTSIDGDYWRLVAPGIYQVTVHAEGWETNMKKNFPLLPLELE